MNRLVCDKVTFYIFWNILTEISGTHAQAFLTNLEFVQFLLNTKSHMGAQISILTAEATKLNSHLEKLEVDIAILEDFNLNY